MENPGNVTKLKNGECFAPIPVMICSIRRASKCLEGFLRAFGLIQPLWGRKAIKNTEIPIGV